MRKLVFLLLIALSSKGFAQLPDDLLCAEKSRIVHRLHGRGNSSTLHGYDIQYHRCHWSLNPKVGPYLKGKVLFVFRVLSNADSLGVDLMSGMQINSIKQGLSNLKFSRVGNAVYISKNGGWKLGSIDSFEIDYEGNPTNNGGFGSYSYDNHKTGPVIHTLSEPYGAPFWWPCKQTLHDKIDSIDIYVHTAKEFKAGSNGLLVETLNQDDTFNIYHWKHRYPVATYLVAMAVTNYDEFTHYAHFVSGDTMPVLNYVFPQFTSTATQETKAVLPVIRLYDSLFVPYPFKKEKYGHAQFTWGGGMEHQTMSFVVNFGFDLMAHELAHQWFGDLVTCGSWQDLWLNEGFATYLNCICYQFLRSEDDFKNRMRSLRDDITSDPNGSVCPSDTLTVNVLFNGRLTYNKGAWVLHQLRHKIGDKAFFEGCRSYLTGSNAYGFGYTPELQKCMEKASGLDLSVYFKQWFFGQGFPYYQIHWKQHGKRLSISYTQTPSNNTVPFWYVRVPLLFKNKKNQQQLITIEPQKLSDSMVVELPFSADTAIFDPEVSVLSKVSLGGINLDLIQKEEIVLAPNPGISELTIYSRNPNIGKVEVYDIVGQLVQNVEILKNPDSSVKLNTQNWASGTYLIRISTQNFVYSKKWQKQ